MKYSQIEGKVVKVGRKWLKVVLNGKIESMSVE